MNQHSVRFSVNRDEVDPFYLAAFLNSDYGYIQVKQRATGATRDALDYPSIKSILIPVLDFSLQEEISLYFRQYAFYRRKSELLIHEAISDIEKLIEGNLDSLGITTGEILSQTWNDIENQKKRNYE
jgi:type I restriction enzyme S subunit